MNRLIRLGYEVLHPWNRSLGYDLAYLVEKEEQYFGFFTFKTVEVIRVQCKTARLSKDCGFLAFNTSTVAEWGRKKHGYHGIAEKFGVYAPALEKVYLVPVAEAGKGSEMRLRLALPKNTNQWGSKMAADYEI